MDDKKVQFIPFHAINEFMLPEFRLAVIQKVFTHMDQIPADRKGELVSHVKRLLKVPGFRNSSAAPIPIKIKNSITPFERNPGYTAVILSCWESLDPDLANRVHDFLKSRGWELLPVGADRSKLPGFMTTWPKDENYDTLGDGFKQMYPEYSPEDYDFRLMVVWLSGRLPYDMAGSEEEEISA